MKTPWTRVSEQATWQSFEAEAMPNLDRLFRLAMWLERDRTEAEDLVQETLAQALQSFHRFDRARRRAWLTTIRSTSVRTGGRRGHARRLPTPGSRRVANGTFVRRSRSLTDEDLPPRSSRYPRQHQESSCATCRR